LLSQLFHPKHLNVGHLSLFLLSTAVLIPFVIRNIPWNWLWLEVNVIEHLLAADAMADPHFGEFCAEIDFPARSLGYLVNPQIVFRPTLSYILGVVDLDVHFLDFSG